MAMFYNGGDNTDPKYRGSSKISYEEALKIAKLLDSGKTSVAIAKNYGVSSMTIHRIKKRYCKTT